MTQATATRRVFGLGGSSNGGPTRTATSTSRELWLAAAGVILLGVAVYGRHITDGGFWFDDWRTVDAVRYHGSLGSLGAGLRAEGLNARPVQTVEVWVVGHLLALHMHWWLLYAVLLGAFASFGLYRLLREAGASILTSALAGALMLVFPFSDSLRLWPAAAQANFSLGVTLLGAVAALRGVRSEGRRSLLWIGIACVAYAIGVLDYEHAVAVIAVVALVGFAYASWRRALLAGVLELGVAAGCLAVVLSSSAPAQQTTISGTIRHFGHIMSDAWQVLGRSALPIESLWKVGSVVAVLLVLAAILGAYFLPAGDALRAPLRRGLALTAAGVLMILAAYALMARASDWYAPLVPGQGNRTNAAAGIGWAVLFTGLVAIAAGFVTRAVRSTPRRSAVLAFAVLSGALAISWIGKTNDDARDWDAGSELQGQVLGLLDASPIGSTAPAGTHVFLFGVPRATRPEVPVFIDRSDLTAALHITFHREIIGLPVFMNASPACATQGPQVTGGWTEPVTDARYGDTYFLDWANQRVLPVPSRRVCNTLLGELRGGPLYLTG